jgi:hypothetical protein
MVERLDQHGHALVRRQPADEEQQPCVRCQAESWPQRLLGSARCERARVYWIAELGREVGAEAARGQQLVAGETAVGERGIGVPHQPAQPAATFEGVAVVGAAEVGRRDAVVVEDDARLAAGQER